MSASISRVLSCPEAKTCQVNVYNVRTYSKKLFPSPNNTSFPEMSYTHNKWQQRLICKIIDCRFILYEAMPQNVHKQQIHNGNMAIAIKSVSTTFGYHLSMKSLSCYWSVCCLLSSGGKTFICLKANLPLVFENLNLPGQDSQKWEAFFHYSLSDTSSPGSLRRRLRVSVCVWFNNDKSASYPQDHLVPCMCVFNMHM